MTFINACFQLSWLAAINTPPRPNESFLTCKNIRLLQVLCHQRVIFGAPELKCPFFFGDHFLDPCNGILPPRWPIFTTKLSTTHLLTGMLSSYTIHHLICLHRDGGGRKLLSHPPQQRKTKNSNPNHTKWVSSLLTHFDHHR